MPPPQYGGAGWTGAGPGLCRRQPLAAREVTMRRFIALLSLSAAVVLLVAGVLATVRPGATPAAAQETLTLIERVTDEEVIDLTGEGDTRGDTLVFRNDLYDADNATMVGTSNGSCVRTRVGEAWECTFTNTLENGSLVVQGPFLDSGEGTFAITGGTGDYAGATGQMSLKASATSTTENPEWEFTFDIR